MSKVLRDLRYRLYYGLVLSHRHEIVTLGAKDSICQWTICPTGLTASSIVYSAGIGSDISFEHDLVQRFGCRVVLFDPSPTGVSTMRRPENQIPQFRFFPYALAGCSGSLRLAPPLDPEGDSWFAAKDGPGTMEVPCVDLASAMAQNGDSRIDLLKLDIEGSEYDVLRDLRKRRLPIGQICVEFHHGILPGIKRRQTIAAMLQLISRGYRLVDQSGANHTFVRKNLTGNS